jgi:hypothetical protein
VVKWALLKDEINIHKSLFVVESTLDEFVYIRQFGEPRTCNVLKYYNKDLHLYESLVDAVDKFCIDNGLVFEHVWSVLCERWPETCRLESKFKDRDKPRRMLRCCNGE